jgi:ferredoxin
VPLGTRHPLPKMRWIAALAKHILVVVRFQDDQIRKTYCVHHFLVRDPQVSGERNGTIAYLDQEPDGTHRVVRDRETRYVDVSEAVSLADLENRRTLLAVQPGGAQYFFIGINRSKVPCGQISGCLTMISVFVRDEHRRQLLRGDSLRPEMLFQRDDFQTCLKEERGMVGPKDVRIAGATARQRTKEEQIAAFGNVGDGEMVSGGLGTTQRPPDPALRSIMMGQTISDVRRRGRTSGVSSMTYVITESCIGVKDGSCADVCPVECIHTMPGDHMYFIDPDECIDCGVCVPECPVDAIYPEEEVPEKYERFTIMNAEYFEVNADRFR